MGLNTELPIELDCFLMNLGFFDRDAMPDFVPYRFKHRTKLTMVVSTTPKRVSNSNSNAHADVFIAEPKEEFVAWRPSFDGEDPLF